MKGIKKIFNVFKANYFFCASLLVLLLFVSTSYSQTRGVNDAIRIKYFTLEDGLSQASIIDLLQDSSGFVWIATQDGLNRFDGSNFKHFKYSQSDSTTISGNFINKLLEDHKGNIWVGTNGNGLNYYDPKFDLFHRVKLEGFLNENETISDLAIDDNKNIWVASRLSGLYKLKGQKDNSFLQEKYLSNQSLSALLYDDLKNLWVGDFKGDVYRINPSEKLSTQIKPEFVVKGRVRAFYYTDKYLLIGSDYGMYTYNFQNKNLNLFKFEGTNHSSVKFINSFLKENDSQVWIGTGNGLFLLDWKQMKIINSSKRDDEMLSSSAVMSLLKLSKNQILAGTTNSLNLLNFTSPFFKNISKDKRGRHLLNDNVIFSIFKDKSDLWVGTFEGGINLIRNGTPYYFENTLNTSKSTFGSVTEIVKDDKNERLWFATTQGLHMINLKTFNPKNPKFKTFRYDLSNLNSISSDYLNGIVLDKNNNIWGATNGYGIFRLEMDDNGKVKIIRYVNNPKNKNSLQNNVTMCIRTDKNNNVWVGTQGGLTKLHFEGSNYSSPVFTNYNKNLKESKTLSDNSVYDILIDSKDSIWVGTRHGLNLFLGNNKFESWIEQKQFTNAVVYSIQDDEDGNLWLGTNDGMVKFNTKNRKFKHYVLKDGIQSKEFNVHTKFRDNQGWVYLGGIGGVTYFNPQDIEKIDKSKPLYFSQLLLKDKVINPSDNLLDQVISKTDKLEFRDDQFPFYLKFSSIDFRLNKNIEYVYKLLPIDKEWNLLTAPEIQFLNLPSGNYTLQVNGFSRGKMWNQAPLEMKLSILPPWWATWWAYMLYSALLGTIISFLYIFNLKRKLAVAEKQKTIELDELKSKMYANISHEFRTPLTLINGLSEVLIEENKDNNNCEKLKGIHHSGNQLLKLVNQMLGLISFDANKIEVNYKNADVIQFIEKCVSYYSFYADSKEQQLTFTTEIPFLKMDFDDDKLQRVLNNILSNAIKFTNKKGAICVNLKKTNQNLNIKITDTGKGIHPEYLPHIFDRYYKTVDTNHNVGTGIGMAFTKELVKLLNGSIAVTSELGKGTEFTVKLPIHNTISQTAKIIHEIPFIDNFVYQENELVKSKENEIVHSLLLVEDNEEIRNYIKMLLGKIYTIYMAKNGVEGFKIAKNKKIDFIISDVMMPKMDGFEFCKQIKNNISTSHIPFIILSAKTEVKDRLEGHRLGIDAYMPKPFDKDELLLIIKNLLKKRQEQINYFSKLLQFKASEKSQQFNQLDLNLIANLQEQILAKHKKLSIEELAKILLTSRTQLHRKVKALTGLSITNYINHIRIEKAKKLLKTTSLQGSEIAYEVGFESATYFSRIFKKELGITPVSYRNKHK